MEETHSQTPRRKDELEEPALLSHLESRAAGLEDSEPLVPALLEDQSLKVSLLPEAQWEMETVSWAHRHAWEYSEDKLWGFIFCWNPSEKTIIA